MVNGKGRLIVFTDLDGTLLDGETYSSEGAEDALELLKSRAIPVVFCSAKTRIEQEYYRRKMDIEDPFIVENGSAILVRRNYFKSTYDWDRSCGDHHIVELGLPYCAIRSGLDRMRWEDGWRFRGFGDMSADEVAAEARLDLEAARRAKQREYTETLKTIEGPGIIEEFVKALQGRGLQCTHGGKFYTVGGLVDKGRAVSIVSELYRKDFGRVRTVGVGDSLNDVPLLASVDCPILLQKEAGVWEDTNLSGIYKAEGVGPRGWAKAIMKLLEGEM